MKTLQTLLIAICLLTVNAMAQSLSPLPLPALVTGTGIYAGLKKCPRPCPTAVGDFYVSNVNDNSGIAIKWFINTTDVIEYQGATSITDGLYNTKIALKSSAAPYAIDIDADGQLPQDINSTASPDRSGIKAPVGAIEACFRKNYNDAGILIPNTTPVNMWYLPAIDELMLIKGYTASLGMDCFEENFISAVYYTSVQYADNLTHTVSFLNSDCRNSEHKSSNHYVRCIRRDDPGTGTIKALICPASSCAFCIDDESTTCTVSYTGGNGGSYAGQEVSSSDTGVTGLKATLLPGNFSNEDGLLAFTISGKPSGPGTAYFSINIGGQSCDLSVTVNPATSIGDNTQIAICTGSNVNFNLNTNDMPGAYKWIADENPNVTGESSTDTINSDIIYDNLINTTNSLKTVVYHISSVPGNCMLGSKTLTVLVAPKPLQPNVQRNECGSPTEATIPKINNAYYSVPTGTHYTWEIVSQDPGITGAFASDYATTHYDFYNGSLKNTKSIMQSVTYRVTLTYGPCSSTFDVTYNLWAKPDIQSKTVSICTGSSCTYTPVDEVDGIVPEGTKYKWYDQDNSGTVSEGYTISTGILTNTNSYTITKTFVVTPYNGDACPGEPFTLTVNVDPKPSVGNRTTSVCSGSPTGLTLSAGTGIAATKFDITNIVSTGLTASAGSPAVGNNLANNVIADDVWTNSTTGPLNVVYTITPKSAAGCVGASFTVTVIVNPKPVVANQSITVCSDVATGFTLPAGTGAPATSFDITRLQSNGLTASAGSPNMGLNLAANVIADDAWTNNYASPVDVVYSITPKSAAGCVGDPFKVTVTVNPKPTITGNLTVCVGSSTQLTGSATAHSTTPWTSSTPSVAIVSNTGLVTGVSAGSTTITYMNSNGCTNTAVVTVNARPTISGNLTVCVGSSTQLTGSATAHSTTPWTSSTPSVAIVSNTGLVTGVSAGSTTITYMNSNGCTNTAVVTVNAKPALGGATRVCVGSTASVTPASGGTWSSSNNGLATVTNGGVVTGVSAGTVTLTFTNSATGCTNTVNVTVNAKPTLGGATQVCVGSTASVTPASGGTWSSSNNGLATVTNGGVVTGVSAGTVTLTFTNSATGCTNTVNVTVNPAPKPILTVTTCCFCDGKTARVVVKNLPKNGSYIYFNEGDGIGASSTIMPDSLSYLPARPGPGSVTITNEFGCSTTLYYEIIEDCKGLIDQPTISSVTQATCGKADGCVTFSNLPSANWMITRLDGDTVRGTGPTKEVCGLAKGTYEFMVTQSKCRQSKPITVIITEPKAPTPDVIIDKLPTCESKQGGFSMKNLPSGKNGWQINGFSGGGYGTGTPFKDFGGSHSWDNFTPGTYTITVTDLTTGCTSDSFKVNIPYPECCAESSITCIDGKPVVNIFFYGKDGDCKGAKWSAIDVKGGKDLTNVGESCSGKIEGLSPGTYEYKIVDLTEHCAPQTIKVVVPECNGKKPGIRVIRNADCQKDPTADFQLYDLPEIWTIREEASGKTYTGKGTSTCDLNSLSVGKYSYLLFDDKDQFIASIPLNVDCKNPMPGVKLTNKPDCVKETHADLQFFGLPAKWYIDLLNQSGTDPELEISNHDLGSFDFKVYDQKDGNLLQTVPLRTITCPKPGAPRKRITAASPSMQMVRKPMCGKSTTADLEITNLPAKWYIEELDKDGSESSYLIKDLPRAKYTYHVYDGKGSKLLALLTAEVGYPSNEILPEVSIENEDCVNSMGDILFRALPYNWTIKVGDYTEKSGNNGNFKFTKVPKGVYQVKVIDLDSGCESNTVSVEICK